MEKDSSNRFFITGIGTDVGKTVVAAIVSEALNAHYWKPIQSGDLDNSDSIKIQNWTANVTILQEQYRLTKPLSPHTSARLDGVTITKEMPLPEVNGTLIVEGAGGILVPVNDSGNTIADVITHWDIPVILVVKHYLGSINHSMLSAEYCRMKGIEVKGWVFNGSYGHYSEEICQWSGIPELAAFPELAQITAEEIAVQAARLAGSLKK